MRWLWNFTLQHPFHSVDEIPLALSDGGRYLVLGMDKLRFWDLSTDALLWEFDFPGDGSYTPMVAKYVSLSADGSKVAVVSYNFELSPPELWLFSQDGRVEWSTTLPHFWPEALRMSRDGTTLVLSLYREIVSFDTSSTAATFTWSSGSSILAGNLALSDDGRSFAETNFGDTEEPLTVYFFERGHGLVWTRNTSLGEIQTGLQMTRNASRMVVYDFRSNSLVALNATGGEVMALHVDNLTSNVAFSAGGDRLLMGTEAGLASVSLGNTTPRSLWDPGRTVRAIAVEGGYLAAVLSEYPGGPESLAFGEVR